MANLLIVDSGFPNTTRDGTKSATADLANLGQRIPLNGVQIRYSRGVNLDDSPYPAQYSDSTLNPSSTQNAFIRISGLVKRNATIDAANSGTPVNQVNLLPLFDSLCSGTAAANVKCLYYGPYTSGEVYSETTDPYKTLLRQVGSANSVDAHSGKEVPSSTPHVHVIVTGWDATETERSVIKFSMDMQVTN